MASIEVLNATQANVEAPVEIQLSLGNPIYRGPEGKPGKDGTIGHDGKSAYEVAVDNGFTGTETEWLASLQGSSANTPVKGVDYFTEQDIQDFIAQIPEPNLSAYATKAELETAIRGAETGLLKRSVVQSLPISNIDDNTIYMVPKIGSTGDVYDEYLYVNNVWEHIGSTDVDLSGYATEEWINSFVNGQTPKRPVRIIDIEPPYQYNHYTSYYNGQQFDEYRFDKEILPANGTEDYEWLSNYLVYGYNEYPTIFRLRPISGIDNQRFTKAYIFTRYSNVNKTVWGPHLAQQCWYVPVDNLGDSENEDWQHYPPYPCQIEYAWSRKGVILNTPGGTWSIYYTVEGAYLYSTYKTIHQSLANKQTKLTAGTGITLSGATISVNTQYLTNSDILAIWNGENN